jgi:hypothetical protein
MNETITLQEFKDAYYDDDVSDYEVRREYNIYVNGCYGNK